MLNYKFKRNSIIKKIFEQTMLKKAWGDFMNKLMNDEIECDIFDLEFETKYFPVSPFTLF